MTAGRPRATTDPNDTSTWTKQALLAYCRQNQIRIGTNNVVAVLMETVNGHMARTRLAQEPVTEHAEAEAVGCAPFFLVNCVMLNVFLVVGDVSALAASSSSPAAWSPLPSASSPLPSASSSAPAPLATTQRLFVEPGSSASQAAVDFTVASAMTPSPQASMATPAAATGPPAPAGGSSRVTIAPAQAHFTHHEIARLTRIMADPANAVLHYRLQDRRTRAQLDDPTYVADPFAVGSLGNAGQPGIIETFFNNHTLVYENEWPTVAEVRGTDPNLHPHARSGEALKAQWTKLKGSFSVAYNRFSASGQNNPDNFMHFTHGDAKLYYMFLAFRESPSLEAILRTLPAEAQRDEGTRVSALL